MCRLGVVCRPDLPCDPVEREAVVGALIGAQLAVRREARVLAMAPTNPPPAPRPSGPSRPISRPSRPPRGRWLQRAAVLVLTVLLLAACSTPEEVATETRSVTVDVSNGRTVDCVIWDSSHHGAGGISCDWLEAR